MIMHSLKLNGSSGERCAPQPHPALRAPLLPAGGERIELTHLPSRTREGLR
ncbi:MAG: hypothetical protein Q27BB25_16840 [Blastomonas sp. CACIA14H2]|nr:MAG: hypothetical protein Q27BB25_16840 [Blastomonas sp. CACIA14H2]